LRSAKVAHLVLPLLVAVLGALMVWQLAARSTIPMSLHGEVVSVRSADEHPGIDNAWFVRIADTTHQVDGEVGRLLRAGDRVDKDAWDRSLLLNGRPVQLELSEDSRAALWFAPTLTAIAAALSFGLWRRSTRRTD
jgi:hypothetical protein